jgi:DNA-binding NtrC family response regulator
LAATNRDLAKEVEAKRFREDLFYRINILSLELPPLRERKGDISLLIAHFLRSGWEIEPAAVLAMDRYAWPGNVRQLINALERAKILCEEETIYVTDLPKEVVNTTSLGSESPSELTDDLASIQRTKVVEVPRRELGNKDKAARALGIERRKLYRLLERFAIVDTELADTPSTS